MPLYDGFFDAMPDGFHEDGTVKYDKEYHSGDFTEYFAQLIGSGVCIHNNEDSFKPEFELDGKLFLRQGYLFIDGYWLANKPDKDEDPADYKGYEVVLPDNQTYAIVAYLNFGKRMIEIELRSVSQAYPDALVLGIVNGAASSVEDTRRNTDICGVIDSLGNLSDRVEYAINYIDNEIESKLAGIEAQIEEKEAEIDENLAQTEEAIETQAMELRAAIAGVQALIDSIEPPPVGSIIFSASQNVGEDWLRCDGSFVSETDYPELVAALGKLTPSADKFTLISEGEIGPQISNGVLYNGRMWVYSYPDKTLYGVDVEGEEEIKAISLTSESEYFNSFIAPTPAKPIALSIVPHIGASGAKLFLAQIILDGYDTNNKYSWTNRFVIFAAEFSEEASSLSMEIPFTTMKGDASYSPSFDSALCVPYVISTIVSGVEQYQCAIGKSNPPYGSSGSTKGGYLAWNGPPGEATLYSFTNNSSTIAFSNQRYAFNPKDKGELVTVFNSSGTSYQVFSIPHGIFNRESFSLDKAITFKHSSVALNVAGVSKILADFTKNQFPWVSLTEKEAALVDTNMSLPNAARVFVDGACYLWGKDIFFIFVGTGIVFSRTLKEGDFGYLDTTSVLGTITQFGYLDYSEDEETLYIVGQDTTNTVKVAKIVLNTLYDYANDGAWLPMIASDGVPAYIKAIGDGSSGDNSIKDPVDITITVSLNSNFGAYAEMLFNGESLIAGTYTRTVSQSGFFSVGIHIKTTYSSTRYAYAKLNGTQVAEVVAVARSEKTVSGFKVSDFISSGIALTGTI